MSNWGFEGNNDDASGLGNSTEGNGPKALRDAYEAMKKQNDELNQQLTSFLEEQRTEKMAKVFETLGVPGAQAAYQGPADPAKAKEWVDSMKSLFGSGQPQQAAEVATPPALPASMQSQFDRLTQMGSDGAALGNVEAAQAAINDATSPQAMIDAFKHMSL